MLIDVNNAEMFNNFESEELTASSKNHLMDDDFFQNENKKLDILTRMISIFDSKDVYLNEFQKLLAEKLYNRTDYNCDDEVK